LEERGSEFSNQWKHTLRPARLVKEQPSEIGADGMIVQDLGIERLARKYFPTLALHTSTQAATRRVAGVRALAKLGFSRVVLARELSTGEAGEIVRTGGIEVETFIHGTLCYSYSGLCLFSSHATGCSGNRGRCSYSCRTTFGIADGETMALSMKDLAPGDRLDSLCDAGAASLKIECRIKSSLYVSAVTDYYRKLQDGKLRDETYAVRDRT
jgi:putative protease